MNRFSILIYESKNTRPNKHISEQLLIFFFLCKFVKLKKIFFTRIIGPASSLLSDGLWWQKDR